MNRADLANMIRRSRNSWVTDATAQVFPTGAQGHLSVCMVLGGDDTAVVTFRDGDDTGTIIRTVHTKIGENIPTGALYFVNGLHVTITTGGTNVLIMGAGLSGALTTPPSSFTPTPPGPSGQASGEFNGTWGFTDFSESPVGDGLPTGWTTPFPSRWDLETHKTLSNEDALNDCPLDGKVFYMLNFNNSGVWASFVWTPVPLGDGESGEVLCLTRKQGPLWINFPCVMPGFALKDNNWVIWGTDNATRSKGYVLGTQTFETTDPDILGGEWHWVRFQRDALMRNYKCRLWHYADPEPVAWDLEVDRGSSEGQIGGNAGFMIPSVLKSSETGPNGYQVKYYAFTTDPAGSPLPLPPAAIP